MEIRRLLFLFSVMICLTGFSQDEEIQQDSVITPARVLIPSFYIDYGKFLMFGSTDERKYEGGIELLYKEKIPILLEVGSGTLTPANAFANGTYESQGLYYRFGTGIYSQFTPKNKFGLTFRYATSLFDETRTITLESPSGLQSSFVEVLDNKNLSASWVELVMYTDRKLNKFLSLGLNLRFRILLDYDQRAPIDVYSIPGYGRSFDKSIPAANLFLKVSL